MIARVSQLIAHDLKQHRTSQVFSLLPFLLVGCSSPSESEDYVTESPPRPTPCLSTGSICTERIDIGGGVHLRVFSTHSLSEGDDLVGHGLIIVHGASRNADDYFQRGFQAAAAAGNQNSTVVIAPHFKTSSDNPASDELFWSSSG